LRSPKKQAQTAKGRKRGEQVGHPESFFKTSIGREYPKKDAGSFVTKGREGVCVGRKTFSRRGPGHLENLLEFGRKKKGRDEAKQGGLL